MPDNIDSLPDDQVKQLYYEKQKFGKPVDQMSDDDVKAAYAKHTQEQSAPANFPGSGMIRGALGALPLMGMAGGAVIGSAAGPIGTVGGGGAGYVAGKSLENFGKGLMGDKDIPQTRQELYGNIPKDFANGVTTETVGQGIGKVASKYGPKIAAHLFKTPEADLATYQSNPNAIEDRITRANGSETGIDEQVQEARGQANKTITDYKANSNKTISGLLDGFTSRKTIPADEIINKIESVRPQINEKLYPDQIDALEEMGGKVRSLADKKGMLNRGDVNDLRMFLAQRAQGQFPGPQGMPRYFQTNDAPARAAKYGSSAARGLLEENSPAITDELSKQAELRGTLKSAPPGLLKEGGNTSSYLAAGRGNNPGNAGILNDLSNQTQTPLLTPAKQISAADSMGVQSNKYDPMKFWSMGLARNPNTLRMLLRNSAPEAGKSLIRPGLLGGKAIVEENSK